jgi:iron complex outermembrane receptor protein
MGIMGTNGVWLLGSTRRRGAALVGFALLVACTLAPARAAADPQSVAAAAPAVEKVAPGDGDAADEAAQPQSRLRLSEQVTVTATKTDTPAGRMPVAAFSVDRAQIEAQPRHFMSNFGELIRDVPGVHVAQYYPWGPPWVHLRGTGYFIGRTAYLVDGIAITPFLSSTINNSDIERVDVVLGPASALYGANASGGAVNIVTRSGEGRDSAAEVGVGVGSFATYRPRANVAGHHEGLHYYASYNGDYSEGYNMKPVEGMVELYDLKKTQYLWDASLEPNEYRYSSAMGKAGWRSRGGVSITGSYNAQWLYLYGGQPGMVLNDDGQQGIGLLRLVAPFGTTTKLTLSAGRQDFDRPQLYIKGLSLKNGAVTLDPTPSTRSEWTTYRVPLEAQVDHVFGGRHTLTGGLFWSREGEVREDYSRATDVRTSKSDYTTDQAALYLQGQTALLGERLSLLAGVRWDSWRFHDIFDQASTNQNPPAIEKDHTTYRLGAKYLASPSVSVRGSFGTAFWPGTALWFFRNVTTGMTWREANPGLNPETTWMADLGLEARIAKTRTVLGVTPYFGEIDDMVSYRYDVNPAVAGGTIIRSLNLGTARIYGLELLAEQRLAEGLTLSGTLTLNRSRLRDSGANSGHQLRNAPDSFGSLSLSYARPALFNAQATLRFSDDRYYDDENTDLPYFHMEAYQTVDLKVWRSWRVSRSLEITTAISGINLLDEQYATEIVYVHPGRTLQADVTVRLPF